jgi:hypothetical protein
MESDIMITFLKKNIIVQNYLIYRLESVKNILYNEKLLQINWLLSENIWVSASL